MTKDLISVIVPVYNVELYLERCIDSLLGQTYRNLEIILVDDGSTDHSGKKCDEYKQTDGRIIVLHKKNGGLSDARNAGLKIAKGNYIGFVDSDDYIETDMYECLYDLCVKYKVPLACARFDHVCEKGQPDILPPATGKIELLESKQMLKTILSGKEDKKRYATYSVWDRLYRKDILAGLEFPKGKCYEDIVYSTRAILNAQTCIYVNRILYHYRLREGSITNLDYQFDPEYQFNQKLLTDKLYLEKKQMRLLKNSGLNDLAAMVKLRAYDNLAASSAGNMDKVTEETVKTELTSIKPTIKEIIFCSFYVKTKIKLLFKSKFLRLYRNHMRRKMK